MSKALLWFRQDLRINDNPALAAACQCEEILAVYILDPDDAVPMGSAQRWWLHHSLQALSDDLKAKGLQLTLFQARAEDCIQKLVQQHGIELVLWNRCYEPPYIARDKRIKSWLYDQGIGAHSFNASLLMEPWEVQNKNKSYFKVFTPFWRQCRQQIKLPEAIVINQWPKAITSESESLADWKLCPSKPDWASHFSRHWQPGSAGAEKRLETFLTESLGDYKNARDFPAKKATSGLSPHLHFGELSLRQIWYEVEHRRHTGTISEHSIDTFLAELGWREFSYHLLYHFPQLPDTNFRSEFSEFPWHEDSHALQCWQRGQTGYPIVDAGMRELWKTGYMHNRVRMIVASFLTKDLLIDWRQGAKWFWNTLLDADLASNSANWQWVAGCGADAAPYFRIFNPVLQGEKFDPDGAYVRQYVPELTDVPAKWIHKPWQASSEQTGIVIGKDYPEPIVDHQKSRALALGYYHAMKDSS